MRIITPQNSAFTPSTGGQDGTYTFSATASGDYAPVDDTFFTPSVNGLYQFSVFAENTDGGATTGALEWEIVQGVTVLATGSFGIFGNTPIQLGSSADGTALGGVAVVFRRSVTGYSGGNSNYRIRSTVALLA